MAKVITAQVGLDTWSSLEAVGDAFGREVGQRQRYFIQGFNEALHEEPGDLIPGPSTKDVPKRYLRAYLDGYAAWASKFHPKEKKDETERALAGSAPKRGHGRLQVGPQWKVGP